MIYHYIKSFLKSLKKNRFFYTINLIGFITGFLVITIIFTFVYQELSFDSFHKNATNIYRIHSGGYGITPLCFADKLKNQIPEITGIVRFSSGDLTIVDKNNEIGIGKVYYTDPDIFQIFSFKLLQGDANTVLNAPFYIVINRSTANKLYGYSSPIGEIIRDKDGTIYTITGVMEDIPYNSHIKANAFISIETLRHTGDEKVFNCGSWDILTYISLSEKSDSKKTEGEINSILNDFRMGTIGSKIPLKLEPLKKVYFDYDNNKYDGSKHGNLQTVALYFAIAFLILGIVIINYINLSTAISGSRMKEIAIRKVNGAGREQIIKQVLLEALGVAVISFIIALFLMKLLLPQLSSLLNIPVSESINTSLIYLYYFIGVTGIGIITGVVPGTYLSNINEIKALKKELIFNTRGFQRKMLLVFQLIIVAVLLNSTFIIKRQINFVLNKDLGFNYENIVYFDLSKTLLDKKEILKNNLLKNPKIKNVSLSDGIIGEGFAKASNSIGDNEKLCYFYSVDPDYLELYQMDIKYGRNFSWDLKTDVNNRCIINEAACKAFGIENPVNKLIGNKEIIGVVKDFNFTSLHNKIEPLIINCGNGNVVQIKISGENQIETLHFIKKTCKDISPDFECDYSFLDNRIKKLYKSELDLKSSFAVYSIITLIIALLGLFGLTLFLIKKKTKEISIRKLYGARLTNTFRLFTTEQVWIVFISNLLAIPISLLVMNGWLNNFQFRVDIGFIVFLKTFLITMVFTLLAISFFIIKTHKTNLIETLKHE